MQRTFCAAAFAIPIEPVGVRQRIGIQFDDRAQFRSAAIEFFNAMQIEFGESMGRPAPGAQAVC